MNPIFGRRASGYFDVRTLSGTKLSPAIHAKKLTLLEKRKTYLTELRKQNGISSLSEDKVCTLIYYEIS